VVLKTTTRQTIFLPVIGLVDGGARGFSFFFSRSTFPFVLPSPRRVATFSPRESDAKPSQNAVVCTREQTR